MRKIELSTLCTITPHPMQHFTIHLPPLSLHPTFFTISLSSKSPSTSAVSPMYSTHTISQTFPTEIMVHLITSHSARIGLLHLFSPISPIIVFHDTTLVHSILRHRTSALLLELPSLIFCTLVVCDDSEFTRGRIGMILKVVWTVHTQVIVMSCT